MIVNSTRAPVPPPRVFVPPAGQWVVAAGMEEVEEPARGGHVGREEVLCSPDLDVAEDLDRAQDMHSAPRCGDPEEWPLGHAILDDEQDGALRATIPGARDLVIEQDVAGFVQETREPDNEGDFDPMPLWAVSAPPGTWVEGKLYASRDYPSSGGIFLREGRRQVEARSPSGVQELFSTSSPIVSIKMSAVGGLIAYLTEGGELGVYSRSSVGRVLAVSGVSVVRGEDGDTERLARSSLGSGRVGEVEEPPPAPGDSGVGPGRAP
ncbi:MAG: hypothetical protein R3F14_05850 [Polyangiaceae bacterium]